jgi:hypothetical protein
MERSCARCRQSGSARSLAVVPTPAERLPTRKLRGVLRQKYDCGATEPVIAQSLGIGCMAGANQLPTRKERPKGRSHKS